MPEKKHTAVKVCLFCFGAIFLLIETHYISAFINTYSMVAGLELLEYHSKSGRSLSSLGVAYSVFVASFFLLRNKNEYPLRWSFGLAAVTGFIVYFSIKELVDTSVSNAKQETIICSFLGNYAKKNFLLGEGASVPFWNSEEAFTPFEDIQLGTILLPAALCFNEQLIIRVRVKLATFLQIASFPLLRITIIN